MMKSRMTITEDEMPALEAALNYFVADGYGGRPTDCHDYQDITEGIESLRGKVEAISARFERNRDIAKYLKFSEEK